MSGNAMDGENEDGQQLPQKENLRESFTIAANALTSLYKKSIRLEQEGRMIGGRDAISGMYEWVRALLWNSRPLSHVFQLSKS
mmetsp:Transcript_15459/g.63056  ORF Transcript_15459/g.63056 Transcript_15459/m.63056 type:complete len:83 (+) Transcript_15459:91-339(+)